MSMLQYRHKSRAWLQMVTADEDGNFRAIKDIIAAGITEGEEGHFDAETDLEELLLRLTQIRDRLAPRIAGLPDDATLRTHLESLSAPLLHTLVVSGPWDTANVGGEEVDIDWLLEGPPASPRNSAPPKPPARPELRPPPRRSRTGCPRVRCRASWSRSRAPRTGCCRDPRRACGPAA